MPMENQRYFRPRSLDRLLKSIGKNWFLNILGTNNVSKNMYIRTKNYHLKTASLWLKLYKTQVYWIPWCQKIVFKRTNGFRRPKSAHFSRLCRIETQRKPSLRNLNLLNCQIVSFLYSTVYWVFFLDLRLVQSARIWQKNGKNRNSNSVSNKTFWKPSPLQLKTQSW